MTHYHYLEPSGVHIPMVPKADYDAQAERIAALEAALEKAHTLLVVTDRAMDLVAVSDKGQKSLTHSETWMEIFEARRALRDALADAR